MNTSNIKKYAPLARRDFIEAVGKRLNQFGVYNKGKALTISEPTVSGSVMQIDGNAFDAGLAPARKRLVLRAEQLGFDALVEHVAYTWFNRLCALRFMELKADYLEHGFRVLSHPDNTNGFEILDHAQDAGNTDFDPTRYQTFAADDDGIIPLTDQDWFKDDATNRFRDFVRTVWGEDNLQENLAFVAESLCLGSLTAKRGEQSMETIRRYLSNQFYKDHLQTYKKRPIYWLFSSGKLKAFECLVYLHRYNDSTLPRMRTEYVTPLLGKYDAYADQLKKQLEDASASEATLLKKDLSALEKKQTELRAFDDKLKHYADRRIKLELDDGVKVNYGKFGDLLAEVKAITGGKE
jgi:hypothetical protein